MAERRMFAKTIIDSDAFLDMPVTARLLYYDLSMRADDDGFVNSPKKIMRMVGGSQDDIGILAAKKFILPFDNGVVVIKHWRIHNYIRKDTYHETQYKELKELLELDENNAYTFSDTLRQLSVDESSTQVRLGKDRLGKDRLGKEKESIPDPDESGPAHPKKEPKNKYGEFSHVLLTQTEYAKLIAAFGDAMTDNCITFLDEYIEMKGYKAKNHYLCIRKWVIDAVKERTRKTIGTVNNNAANQLEQSYAMMSQWAEGDTDG